MILRKTFYERPTLRVAQDLLGCFLIRKIVADKKEKIIKTKIVETEAYNGPHDLASHASRGKTPRNEVMFDIPGTIYVYFTYGMHYMFNIVTERKDYPAAVLIRAVELIDISDTKIDPASLKSNGPARLTKALRIDKKFNGLSICDKQNGLWIEAGEKVRKKDIVAAPRIGVDYAGEYKDKLWRFYIDNNRSVSRY